MFSLGKDTRLQGGQTSLFRHCNVSMTRSIQRVLPQYRMHVTGIQKHYKCQ